MNATLGPQGVKSFAKILRFLAKIGNEIFMQALERELRLKLVNGTKTSFCTVILDEEFFHHYQPPEKDKADVCMVPVRPLLQVLKNIKNVSLSSKYFEVYLEVTNRMYSILHLLSSQGGELQPEDGCAERSIHCRLKARSGHHCH